MTFSLVLMLAPTNTVFLANVSYAQLLGSTTPSSPPVTSSSTLLDNAVTITSPQDGQRVPIGQDLEVTGTSMANAASDCTITVNLNRVKPYQPAVANGPGGANDYSQWSFTTTSKYASIQEGQNRIAAKISCSSDPNSKQIAHVNVTGVASSSFSSSIPDTTLQSQRSPPQTSLQTASTTPFSLIQTMPSNNNDNNNLNGNNNNHMS